MTDQLSRHDTTDLQVILFLLLLLLLLHTVTINWCSLRLPTKGWPGWVYLGGWSHIEINVRRRKIGNWTVLRADVDQVYQWASTRYEGWTEENVLRLDARPAWRLQLSSVEESALCGGVSSQYSTGAAHVRTSRLEHSLRVQRGWLPRQRTVYSKPSRRHGSKEGSSWTPRTSVAFICFAPQ